MAKSLTFTGALVALAMAVSACGSSGSTAAGVQLAPSQGLTQSAVTTASVSATTSTAASATSTGSTPLPAALKTKPKVVPPSGPAPSKLVVKDLIAGTGPAATPASTVTLNYVGLLFKGGKEFDSTWKRGTPDKFPLGQVIPGWQQGIPGMKEG